jgi:hypothetical protein
MTMTVITRAIVTMTMTMTIVSMTIVTMATTMTVITMTIVNYDYDYDCHHYDNYYNYY